MQIREFSQPVTAKALNEGLAQKFGYKINLEQFSDVQLEDARNKLRTRISQFEMNESFDSVLESPEYQKTRMFLDCINQEIIEREETQLAEGDKKEQEPEGTYSKKRFETDGQRVARLAKEKMQEKKKDMKKNESYIASAVRQRATQLAVPNSWIENTIAKINLGEADRDELKAELKLRYDLSESRASWLLCEGEENKAEIIMSTKDMVDRITGWLEDVAAMKAEQLLELTDSIREELGSDAAQQYEQAVKPALEAIYTALETSRQGLSSGLAVISGGEAPGQMGAPAGGMAGMGPEAGAEELGADLASAGEEVADAMPPAAEAGREKRESVDYSRRLGLLLNSKKK